jgi:hypothetical protein
MTSISQQQRTALSFNGRTLRFERKDRGSNPRGAAKYFSDQPLGNPVRAFADTFSAESVIMDAFFAPPPVPAR